MILQFVAKDGKDCYFDVDDLNMTSEDITYDDINLYIDGSLYDGESTTWSGRRLKPSDFFNQVINAYLRNDSESYSFDSDWSIFDSMLQDSDYVGNIPIELPQLFLDSVDMYTLDLATTDFRFYLTESGDFLALNKNGGLVTDYENFYLPALYEEIEEILNGTTECLYMSEELKEYIDQNPDEFLSE